MCTMMQVSRLSGRVRAPPLAFWANQVFKRDPKTGHIIAIDPGFTNQLPSSAGAPGDLPLATLSSVHLMAACSSSNILEG